MAVACDDISGQKVHVVQANIMKKFDDPTSNRLRVIESAHFVTTTAAYAYSIGTLHTARHLVSLGVENMIFCGFASLTTHTTAVCTSC